MTQLQQFIIPEEESLKTFDFDERLPNLPLPPLEHTIKRYLESVKPFYKNEAEFSRTKKIARRFLKGEGAVLHSKISHRSSRNRNWVEKWWEDYAYLNIREPSVPNFSMAGPHLRISKFPYGDGQQIKMASLISHQLVRFWQLLRREKLRPAVTASQQPLCMHQFRRVFNCSVTPGVDKDSIRSYFKTEQEGSCSSQVLVLCNGHMFMVDGVRRDGQPLTVADWEHQLTAVRDRAAAEQGPGVACLASDNRTSWAQNKERLIKINPANRSMFSMIDAAMFVLSLDNASPMTDSEICQLILTGDYTCRWPDTANNVIVFNNGLSGGLCAHSTLDGIVSGTVTLFVCTAIEEFMNGQAIGEASESLTEPVKLNLLLNKNMLSEIERLKNNQNVQKNYLKISVQEFDGFGKQRIQRCKVHPDAFVQMSLQLAYYSLHKRFAPCYETATTRAFFHGRTETVRSCSQDCTVWVKAMEDPKINERVRAKLLLKAIQKHNDLMSEARSGKGCDRHLLGLYCTAVENGIPTPALFQDPSFANSGGGGNFILSTSLLGYYPITGGVAPMCFNGYGVFYSILPTSLLFTISEQEDCVETSSSKLFQSISNALQDMISLLESHTSSKL